jgi:hypothetical protein
MSKSRNTQLLEATIVLAAAVIACSKPQEVSCFSRTTSDSLFYCSEAATPRICIGAESSIDTVCMDFEPKNSTYTTIEPAIGLATQEHKKDIIFKKL